jgi:hypothetical protein
MRRCAALLLPAFLWWAGPVSAQTVDPPTIDPPKVYPLTVSIHAGVHPGLTESAIEQILQLGSALLQQQSCPVGFKLNGPVTTFTSAPAIIENADDLEAVHNVPADVKVVQRIHYCVGGRFDGLIGCSWRPEGRRKTVIVTTESVGNVPGKHPVLWTHEFGHTTGLPHRLDEHRLALMSPCGLRAFSRQITTAECQCFLAGPGGCQMPESEPACPASDQN